MMSAFNPGYADRAELLRLGFGAVGSNVHIARNCTIIGFERITIGDNVRIDGPTTIVVSKDSHLSLGSFIHISGGCHLSAVKPLIMNDFSGLSQGVRLFTATDDYSGRSLTNPLVPEKYKIVHSEMIDIGRHVIIGAGSVVLPGASIGEGSSIGALSLVTRPLPEWSVCAGTPCVPIKARERELLKLEEQLLAERSPPSPNH